VTAPPSCLCPWEKKDLGAWSIPKGEYQEGEDPLACALREFEEELGVPPPGDAAGDLGSTRQRGGKLVRAWAAEGDLDPTRVRSNTFTLEWPPRSGVTREFPRSTAPSGSPALKGAAGSTPHRWCSSSACARCSKDERRRALAKRGGVGAKPV
jgi:predicted NUDIX family NTP pyrophosphohydrolase